MATLAEVRIGFVVAAMRYDLVVDADITANVDNGANYFINEGQKFLDLTVEHPQLRRRWMGILASGEVQIEVQGLIAVEAITVITSDKRSNITDNFMGAVAFREEHNELIADWDTDEPSDWTLNITGLAPELIDSTAITFAAAGVVDYDDVHFGGNFAYDGILFYPKADADYTVEVMGKFLSPTLSADDDVSYWTVKHQSLSELAACYALERTLRDSAGMQNWLDAMKPYTDAIDSANVEFELAGLEMRMEG